MVSIYNLFVSYLNITATLSRKDSYSLQDDYNPNISLKYDHNPTAIPTKGIVKLSLFPTEPATPRLIVSTPFPSSKKTSFSNIDQVILFNDNIPHPKDPMFVPNFNWALIVLEVQFQKIISFSHPIKRKSLFKFRNKVESFLQKYECHILQNNQTDPHTIHNMVYAVLLWDKTTILKNLIKSGYYHHRLNLLKRIKNKESPLYRECYNFVYEIFENQMRAMNNTQYHSHNLDIYLQQTDVAIMWNQITGSTI